MRRALRAGGPALAAFESTAKCDEFAAQGTTNGRGSMNEYRSAGRSHERVPQGMASKGRGGVGVLRELVERQRDGVSVNIAALAAGRRTTYFPLTCATT